MIDPVTVDGAAETTHLWGGTYHLNDGCQTFPLSVV
jgi:hypothetical protein